MATKKKLLEAAAGSAGGGGGLNVEQVFSTYLYTGNGGGQAIENGINLSQSYGSGSVNFYTQESRFVIPNNADFTLGNYWSMEAWIFPQNLSGDSQTIFGRWYAAENGAAYIFYVGGTTLTGGVYPNYTSIQAGTVAEGQWQHILFSYDGTTLRGFINGTVVGTSTNSSSVTSAGSNDFTIGNNGNAYGAQFQGFISDVRVRKFSSSTGVPVSNFTPPTAALTADSNTVLLTCQSSDPFVDNSSSAHSISVENASQAVLGPFDAADAGEGGLVWTKGRSAADGNRLFDTERGATKGLITDTTLAEFTLSDGLTSFNSNGFSISTSSAMNTSSNTYASWTFRKAPKFFTCVTYTGNGVAGREIAHDLGTTVGMLVVKSTSHATSWKVQHRSTGATNALELNDTRGASDVSTAFWNDTAPTSTHFTVGTDSGVNTSGRTYVAYLFAHNDGDGDFGDGTQDIIKCGSFTYSGEQFFEVDLGWEPQWVMTKRIDSSAGTANWDIMDSMRGMPVPTTYANASNLEANTSYAEGADTATWPRSNGFGIEGRSNGTYIYIAIRRGPMAVPESATDVFAMDYNTGSAPSYISNFPVDFMINKNPSGGSNKAYARLLGAKLMYTNATNAETSDPAVVFDYMNGAINNANDTGHFAWMWKRAPSFMDVVAYTGNSTAGRTVSHNLGVAPEMIWVKKRNAAAQWGVYHSAIGSSKYMHLDNTDGANSGTFVWNGTDPTATDFTVGDNDINNLSGGTYIAYLFASVDGVSKVGSYTATGSDQNIDCGFSNGARFVLIKGASLASGWIVIDTERGLVTGVDPFLRLESTTAENTGYDMIDPYSSGFTVTGSNGNVNSSGETYIFYAIA